MGCGYPLPSFLMTELYVYMDKTVFRKGEEVIREVSFRGKDGTGRIGVKTI